MTAHMLIVFGVLAGAVALFASGRVRPDVVAILVVLALNLSGVLTIQEALAGFGQPVVILIAAVSIVGEGLIATGVTYRLGEAVVTAAGSKEARLVALVMVLAGTVGAFMSSSAIVAMFIPVVMAIANKTGLNQKRMLMPLSVAALISGMMTLIASSPNMIVEDTLRARGLAPFGFFSWTPFGAAVLATAIAFMVIAGRNMLSRQTAAVEGGARQPSAYDLLGSYDLADKWHRLQVPRSSPLVDRSMAQVQLLDRFGTVLVGFEKHPHGREQFLPAMPETVFEPEDAIYVVGSEEQARQLTGANELVVLPRLDQRQRHEALQEVGVAEIMLAPESKLIGQTLRQAEFSSRYDLNILALATALSKTGATQIAAHGMVALLGSLGPLVMLAAVFLVTAVVGLFISNAATAVLIAPVAIDAARALHVSPHAFAITVSLGCCAAFVTPVSSAVNMLVMEPGGYTFGDYVKVGLPLLLLTMVVTVVLAALNYPLGGF